MICAGIGVALVVAVAVAIARREAEHAAGPERPSAPRELDRLAATILFQLLLFGGIPAEEARREIRRRAGLMGQVTDGIDVGNWGESFARITTPQQRAWLLDMAVQCVAARSTPVPLRQYSGLLDLSFALGFQTDALARLRERYGFQYVDHAKNARPRDADRACGAAPLFVREGGSERAELLWTLGLEAGSASRRTIIAAYRGLAAQHHPDRFHLETAEVQSAAAARFIEITKAYERLLVLYPE
jgi:DnaJ domain